MEIIFNEEEAVSWGDPDDPRNTPEKLVERRRAGLIKLGEFVGAERIEFVPEHKRDIYILTKGGKKLSIIARGNGFDGGWLEVE